MSEGPSTDSAFLSTLPPSRAANRLALAVVVVIGLLSIAAAPFAKLPLSPLSGFLPIYQSALVTNELITAVLLFGQFHILRERSLLILACAYLLSAIMAAAHLLSFPGLLAAGGVIGGGPQTTAWLYFLWHAAFPLLVMGYALARSRRHPPSTQPRRDMAAATAATLALAAVLILATTVGHDALPPIMAGNRDAPAKFLVAFPTWCLCIAALAILWRRRGRSVMDLWIMVVMWVWIFDIALASVLNGGRFDLGWYLGRVYGLAAGSVVLAVMLLENSLLYARLATAHRDLGALNKEMESFSYSVSHDLVRPVRAVDGFARMLEEDYAGRIDAEGQRLLGVIRSEAGRMGEMIKDLLAFSRLGRQPLAAGDFDTQALVDEVVAALRPEAKAGARIERAALPPTHGDASLLRQVWINLIANAIKYSGKREQPVVEIGSYQDGGFDVFFVKDNGAGFDMKLYDKLFGVFQRMHSDEEFPGTGVGLATVQKIVSRHGGVVWATARPDAGATFYFSLPRAGQRALSPLSSRAPAALGGVGNAT